jgi:hypothetical protein
MSWVRVAVVVAAGCGDRDSGDSFDATIATDADGSFDGSNGDAPAAHHCNPSKPAGPVTVRRHFPGFRVLSHDATGAYLNQVNAGTSYTAQIDVPGCGAITLIGSGSQPAPDRTTILALDPGDEIDIGGVLEPTMFQQVFIDQPFAGATQYQVVGGNGCGGLENGTPSSVAVRYDSRCADANGKFTLLAFARDLNLPDGERLLGYAVLEKVSLSAPLHITSWLPPTQHHLTATLDPNVPATSATWLLQTLVNGIYYDATGKTAVGSASSFDIDLPYAGFGDLAWSNIDLMYPGGRERFHHEVIAAPVPSQVNAQLTTQLMPFVHTGLRDSDPVRPTLSWIVDSNMVEEDIVSISVPVAPLTSPGTGHDWLIFAPPGTRMVRVPEQPASMQVRFPAAADRVSVKIADFAEAPDYRAARQAPFRFTTEHSVPVLGAVDRASWIER